MSQEEKTMASFDYIRIRQDAHSIVAHGIKMGWLSYPKAEQNRRLWNQPTDTDSSLTSP